MGAWAVGNFGNDDALDFWGDVEKDGDTELIHKALQTALDTPDDDLEAEDCSKGLVAAEFVATAAGNPPADLPDGVAAFLSAHPLPDLDALKDLARRVEKRVKTEGELHLLWEESDHHAEWVGVLDDLSSRLG